MEKSEMMQRMKKDNGDMITNEDSGTGQDIRTKKEEVGK